MQVLLSERVKTALRILSHDDRNRVVAWFDYLRNWEEDQFVRSHSVMLDVQGQSVYMLRTSSEIRIFYTVDQENKTVSVIDVTTKDTILSSGGVPTGVGMMSKDFTEVTFDHVHFKKELDQFGALLDSTKILGERELAAHFKASQNLTAYLGCAFGINIGVAK